MGKGKRHHRQPTHVVAPPEPQRKRLSGRDFNDMVDEAIREDVPVMGKLIGHALTSAGPFPKVPPTVRRPRDAAPCPKCGTTGPFCCECEVD